MKILFICTHNRCRSILSEAITNHLAQGAITAYSAGSAPVGQVHPLSVKYLDEKGVSTEGLKSQSWDEFESIQPDIVVTVCDSAAAEACPVWFGNTVQVHWGLPDPSKLSGSEAEVKAAFYAVINTIETRARALLELNLDSQNRSEWLPALQRLPQEA